MTEGRDNGSALVGFLAGLGRARRKLALAVGAFAPRPLFSVLGGARAWGFAPPWADGRFFGLIERRDTAAASPVTSAPVAAPRGSAALVAPVAAPRGSAALAASVAAPSRLAALHRSEAQDRAARSSSDPRASVQASSSSASSSAERGQASFAEGRPGTSKPQPNARNSGPGVVGPPPVAMAAARRSALAGLAPLLALLPRARGAGDGRVAAGTFPALARVAPASLSVLSAVTRARALPVSGRIHRYFPREDQPIAAVAGTPGSFATASAADGVLSFASAAPDAAVVRFGPPARSPSDSISAQELSQRLPARALTPELSAAMRDNETPPLLSQSAGRDPLRQMARIAESLREEVASDLSEAKAFFTRARKEAPNAPAGRAPTAVTDDFARRLLARMRELMREERFRNGELR
jgi:hypothetical protein